MTHAILNCRAQLVPNGAPHKLHINRRTALVTSLTPVVALTSNVRAVDARTDVVPLADLPMRR